MCGNICIEFIDFMPKDKMLSKKLAMCDSKNSRFIKQEKASGLLGSLEMKISILSRLPVAEDILF